MTLDEIMALAPVIPVLVIDDAAHARPLAEALVAGGLRALEVTLRTPAALDAIEEMAKVPGAVVGAGTVLNAGQVHDARAAGARFMVSPGLTEAVTRAAHDSYIPLLPGIANASDIMRGLDFGLRRFKFFPAVPMGGLPVLDALAGPFADLRFCPTGGISAATAPEWLRHPAVACVGGSWLYKRGETDWIAVRTRAATAAALRG
jgi:2-dehydro-3-deoxyphosphogluconate aldolase/(4S)-4-hydroxy-2-oxoglutarate aldolase